MRRALLLVFAAGWLSAQTPAPTGSIHGVVTDEATGLPVRGAVIRVGLVARPMDGRSYQIMPGTASAMSDDQGRYTIAHTGAGSFMISVLDGRHQQVLRPVQLNDGQDLALDFLIPPNPSISGRVLDENKKPVANAFVWVIQSQYILGRLKHTKLGPAFSAKDGSFSFDVALQQGRGYYLLADPPVAAETAGQEDVPPEKRERIAASTYYGDATSFGAAAPLVLFSGEHRTQADIKLRTATPYCADGRVEVSGKPAAASMSILEAEVTAGNSGFMVPSFDSAENGIFRLCGLTPGEYLASVTERGGARFTIADSDVHHVLIDADTAKLQLELAWDGDAPAEPEARPDPPPPALPASLQGGGDIVISPTRDAPAIVDPQMRRKIGLAVGAQISVSLAAIEGGARSRMLAAAPYSGAFGSELIAGDYALDFDVAPGSYIKQVTYGGVAVADKTLHLAPGTSGTLRVVAARGGGAITAKVTDSDGQPVANTTVVLLPEGIATRPLVSIFAARGLTGQSGLFTSETLAPGKYRVLALTRNYQDIPEDLDKLILALSKAETAEVGSNGNVRVNLHALTID